MGYDERDKKDGLLHGLIQSVWPYSWFWRSLPEQVRPHW